MSHDAVQGTKKVGANTILPVQDKLENPEAHQVIRGRPVLLVSGVRGDTRRYRTLHPYEQLCLAGVPVEVSHLTDPKLPSQVEAAAVIIFHRVPWDNYVQQLIERAQAKGEMILIDVDDLIFDPSAFQWIDSPDFQDPVRARLYQEEMRRHQRMVSTSQAGLASTEYLAAQVRAMERPAWIHRNAFSLEMLTLSEKAFKEGRQPKGKVILGYASGTPTHDHDFELVKPAIQATLRHFPGTELWLIGPVNPGAGWGDLEQQIRRFPRVHWGELPGLLVQFDINLAPLVVGNPFSQSKSEIKWMEAGLVRVPTVASPTQAFTYAIRSGENGFLASEEGDWEETLSQLANDTGLRESTGEQAYRNIVANYHPLVRARQLIDSLNEISVEFQGELFCQNSMLHDDAANQSIDEISITMMSAEKHPTLAEMAGYTLRHRGALTLLKQEWAYLRRAAAPVFPYRQKQKSPQGEG